MCKEEYTKATEDEIIKDIIRFKEILMVAEKVATTEDRPILVSSHFEGVFVCCEGHLRRIPKNNTLADIVEDINVEILPYIEHCDKHKPIDQGHAGSVAGWKIVRDIAINSKTKEDFYCKIRDWARVWKDMRCIYHCIQLKNPDKTADEIVKKAYDKVIFALNQEI